MPTTHCEVHQSEMEVIHDVSADVKWIKRFGGWWMALTGGALIVMIPIAIGFFVYVSKVESRLCVVEYKLEKLEKR